MPLTATLLIAELAPRKQRGMLVSINEVFIVGGILISFIINYICQGIFEDPWRYAFGFSVIPSIIQLIGFCVVPTSPRWLVSKRRYHDALITLIRCVVRALKWEINIKLTRLQIARGSRGSCFRVRRD